MKTISINIALITLVALINTSCLRMHRGPKRPITEKQAVAIAYSACKDTLGGADPNNVVVAETNGVITVYFNGEYSPDALDGFPGQVSLDAQSGKVLEILSGP